MDGAPFCPSVIGNIPYQYRKMSKIELSTARLEASLNAKIERHFDTLDTDPDVLKQLLADKRSENTRRAYEKDVNDFLKTMTGKSAYQ
jgi:integrase/recombinase XerC